MDRLGSGALGGDSDATVVVDRLTSVSTGLDTLVSVTAVTSGVVAAPIDGAEL